jgi:hypothetical protein
MIRVYHVKSPDQQSSSDEHISTSMAEYCDITMTFDKQKQSDAVKKAWATGKYQEVARIDGIVLIMHG